MNNGGQAGKMPRRRAWGLLSLHLRLAIMINTIVLVVLTGFWLVDNQREVAGLIRVEIGRLREEARVLQVARETADSSQEFQLFLDRFCQQMGVTASPGHHIAIFNDNGELIARAHERADARLEATMAQLRGPTEQFRFQGDDYLAVNGPESADGRIVIAQSLQPIEQIIRAQAVSRAASLGLLAVLIFASTTLFVLHWVRDPLNRLMKGVRAIGDRRFDTRVEEKGGRELRFLAAGVNDMAQALERVEYDRQSQMRRAQRIQHRLLPSSLAGMASFEAASMFQPADAVAGDLYDVIDLGDDAAIVVVMDVSGHGVAAALYTALLRAVLHSEVKRTTDPAELMQAMNSEFAAVSGTSGEFATCFLARIEAASGRFRYVSAGHEPAVLTRVAEPQSELLESNGFPLGILADANFASTEVYWAQKDRLILYTDGVHEVLGPGDEFFGRERLLQVIRETVGQPATAQLEQILERVKTFGGDKPFADDLTLLAIDHGRR